MAKFYNVITPKLEKFILAQKIFFVATAPKDGRINLSPKGMDTFRVLNEKQVAWLSVTGSGNETSAHLLENGRITIMLCAFNGAPNILRIYGKGTEITPKDSSWNTYVKLFPKLAGTRQIFLITIKSVQTSCGMAIPFFEYQGERNQLLDWAKNKGSEAILNYQQEKNRESIDNLPTKLG